MNCHPGRLTTSVEAEDTDHLTEEQRQDLAQLLSEFQDVLSDIPGKTK